MNERTPPNSLVVLKPGSLSQRDVRRLREAGFCVVTAKTPDAVTFFQHPDSQQNISDRAALAVFQDLLTYGPDYYWYRRQISEKFATALLKLVPLTDQKGVEK